MNAARILSVVLALALALPVGATAAPPSNDADLRRRVMVVLNAHEYRPAGALWKKWGARDVNDILAQVALDTHQAPRIRSRAAMALAELPSERSRTTLRAMIAHEGNPMSVRRQALMSLAAGFPRHSFDDVRHRLLNGPTPLREAAAHASVPLFDPRIDTILKDRAARDPDLVVREAVERTVAERHRLAAQRRKTEPRDPVPTLPAHRDRL